MTIFYIQYHAEPDAEGEQFGLYGGAYVTCWVRAASVAEAEKTASAAIRESGWKIVAVEDECCAASESWYSDDDEGKQYFLQAVIDGECYVFHQWPPEPQEGDAVH